MVALDPFLRMMNLVYAPASTDVNTWPLNLRQEFKGELSPRILTAPTHAHSASSCIRLELRQCGISDYVPPAFTDRALRLTSMTSNVAGHLQRFMAVLTEAAHSAHGDTVLYIPQVRRRRRLLRVVLVLGCCAVQCWSASGEGSAPAVTDHHARPV